MKKYDIIVRGEIIRGEVIQSCKSADQIYEYLIFENIPYDIASKFITRLQIKNKNSIKSKFYKNHNLEVVCHKEQE